MSASADGFCRALMTAMPQVTFAERRVLLPDAPVHEHSHADLFQVSLFPSGTGVWLADGIIRPIDRRQVFLAAPGSLHAIEPSGTLEVCTIRFRLAGYAGAALPAALELDAGMAQRCADLIQESVGHGVAEPMLGGLRLAEALYLAGTYGREPVIAVERTPLTVQAIAFLEARYRERISIGSAAEAVGVSEEHLCRVFKQDTRTSPMAFLQRIRVGFAAERLFTTDDPLSDVAVDAGFGNVRNMRTAFLRLHRVTPQAFRDHHREY